MSSSAALNKTWSSLSLPPSRISLSFEFLLDSLLDDDTDPAAVAASTLEDLEWLGPAVLCSSTSTRAIFCDCMLCRSGLEIYVYGTMDVIAAYIAVQTGVRCEGAPPN